MVRTLLCQACAHPEWRAIDPRADHRAGRRRVPSWRVALRRAVIAPAVLAIGLVAGHAHALGLGEIELDSALNERLVAHIELLDAGSLQPTEILVSLASQVDFDRIGVERFFYLTDLRFEVVDAPRGKVVRVTTSQPVSEPYLNFIVQAHWPSGRLLREYTLLLDPPSYGDTASAAISAPAREEASTSAGRVERTTSAPAGSGTEVALRPAPARPRAPADGDYRMTTRNDTLWRIASEVRPDADVTIQQTMLALLAKNPQAFIRGNVNLLKAGYELRLPSAAEARAMDARSAQNEVAQQDAEWRAGTRRAVAERPAQPADGQPLRAQVDATDRAAPLPDQATTEGRLRIVAGDGDSVRGSEAASQDGARLAEALEERDRLQRRVDELSEQLDTGSDATASQVAMRDRQIELQNQQIAELEAQLAASRVALDAARTAQPQNQSASQPPAPWWTSTWVLAVLATILVLALAAILLRARRRDTDTLPEPRLASASVAAPIAAVARAPIVASRSAAPAVESVAEFDDAWAPPDAQAPEDEAFTAFADGAGPEPESQTGDVIGEAEIYIAYGRYAQAVTLLNGVLANDPVRYDVRLKLLEIHADTGDRAAFDSAMAELLAQCDEEEVLFAARDLESRLPMAAARAPARLAEPEPDPIEPAAVEPVADAHDRGDADDDFELEIDKFEVGEPLLPDEPLTEDLGGDLGLDFDPGEPPEENRNLGVPLLDLEDAAAAIEIERDGDNSSTKLDLARAYLDMGDEDGAREILTEVLNEGNEEQRSSARRLLEQAGR